MHRALQSVNAVYSLSNVDVITFGDANKYIY